MHYVYLIKSNKNNNLYIGCTSNLKKRLNEHNSNKVRSTINRGPYELVYCEIYKYDIDAFKREENLKLRSNALTGLKIRLVESLR